MPRFRPHKMYPGALLAQEACSYQAMTQLLMRMRGRLAVLVHSDRDCSNVLPKTGGRVQADLPYKFFCTNLREDEIVTGQGNVKLRKAIELIHAAHQPDLLVVLSTCPTVMIGDNLKQVARKAGRELGIRVAAELTHGLKPKSPAEIVDDCYRMLSQAGRPSEHPDRDRRVNLVGISLDEVELAEIETGLRALDLELNVVLNGRSVLDDFLRVADARYNVHPGPHMLLRFDEACAEQFGMTAVEVPLPFGVGATDRFWQAIARATGRPEQAVLDALRPVREPALAAMQAFRQGPLARTTAEQGRPPRCAYNIGSVRSFDLRRIALEELGELPFFEELGFDTALFIQGPQDAGNVARTREVLEALGVDNPFVIFPDPGGLARFVRPGDFDLFFGADFLRDQLTRLNLPLVNHRQLVMGYGLVPHDLQLLETALTTRFYDHFTANPPPPAQAAARPRTRADVRRPDDR